MKTENYSVCGEVKDYNLSHKERVHNNDTSRKASKLERKDFKNVRVFKKKEYNPKYNPRNDFSRQGTDGK